MAKHRYVNCVEVMRGEKKIWRARLVFPFDDDLGYRPAAKDFYGKTAAEADAKRKAYKPLKKGIDAQTSFVEYLSAFIARQEELSIAGQYSWAHFLGRKSRLERFIISPEDEKLDSLAVRRVSLAALTPDHIKDLFHALTITGVKNEPRRKIKDDIRLALKECRKRIAHPWRDYFEDVSTPRVSKSFSQREIYDWRMVCQAILDETKPIRDRALVAFAIHTMRRPSEMFALTWKDINWESAEVIINKAVVQTHAGIGVKNSTKNGKETAVHLSQTILGLLHRLQTTPLPVCETCSYVEDAPQHRSHEFRAKMPSENDFIFLTDFGKPLTKETFRGTWRGIKKTLGLPDGPAFYSLKHTGNSAAQEMGVSVAALADRMGHKSDEMARLTYRVVLDSEKQKAVNAFDNMLALARPEEP